MHAVEILALDDVVPFDLSAPLQVFDWARLPDGRRPYRVRVCAGSPEVRGEGLVLRVDRGLDALRSADTVIVPGCNPATGPTSPAALDALREAAAAGTRIASVCSGAFILAEAGLLDGLPATTHWAAAAELARRHPEIDVRPDVLYVDNGQIITSAGAAAALDMCLHLVRRDHGSAVAADSARRAVVPLEREGGQAQFIVHEHPPVPRGSALEPVLEWIGDHLADEITVGTLAARAGMSERTFGRRFREQTGTTPLRWLLAARVRRAQYLLESGDLPVERVARQAGFGSPTAFRERFRQVVGTSPQAYRTAFRGRSAEPSGPGGQTASGSSPSPLGAAPASSRASAAATASSTVAAPVSAHSA